MVFVFVVVLGGCGGVGGVGLFNIDSFVVLSVFEEVILRRYSIRRSSRTLSGSFEAGSDRKGARWMELKGNVGSVAL